GDDLPVECVTWHQAVDFCERLSRRAAEKRAGRVYRLPTEAEWERACRGGARTSMPYHFGFKLSGKEANFDTQAPTGAPASRSTASTRCRSAPTARTPTDFSTCTATSASGAPTGTTRITTAAARPSIRPAPRAAATG